MLKMKRMWKYGYDVICFNTILCVFVKIMQHSKLGTVRQFCVFIASCVCWLCWLRYTQ
jgi:hypothetical protein